jgi:hypothetical protein
MFDKKRDAFKLNRSRDNLENIDDARRNAAKKKIKKNKIKIIKINLQKNRRKKKSK